VRVARLPLHPSAVYGLIKEVKAAADDLRPIVIAGAAGPAGRIVGALAENGDVNALRDLSGREVTRYDLQGAGLLIYAIEGDTASPDDEKVLKLADRNDVGIICVLSGTTRHPLDLPFVPAGNVVPVGAGQAVPIDRIAELVASLADENGYGLAARLPVLRPAVVAAIVRRFSRQNGVLGVAIFVPGADFPVLTLNQLRMLFRIAAAHGEEIDRERLPEVLAIIGAGLGFRTIAREALGFIPALGWAVKGGIAYVGTRALGKAAVTYFEQGGAGAIARAADAVRSRS